MSNAVTHTTVRIPFPINVLVFLGADAQKQNHWVMYKFYTYFFGEVSLLFSREVKSDNSLTNSESE